MAVQFMTQAQEPLTPETAAIIASLAEFQKRYSAARTGYADRLPRFDAARHVALVS
jgi:hypothetical protein